MHLYYVCLFICLFGNEIVQQSKECCNESSKIRKNPCAKIVIQRQSAKLCVY